MKLIAESGGTKTQWCGISATGETEILTTIGLNPNFVTEETIRSVLTSEVLPVINNPDIREVWFYGAGCAGKVMENKIRDAIGFLLPSTAIYVFSDLTGAARSLLGRQSGFVCMLGTGSNSGYYDGKSIVANVPPLGFILGDEGSGASLGKKILADFLRGIMPPGLAEEFKIKYGAEKDDVVSNVYRGYFPSKFIGGFVQFLKDHLNEEYCRVLVKTSFEEFVRRNLRLYKISGNAEIAVTGSVAWYFREILEEVFRENGFILSTISKEPITGLIRYHKKND
jgi:N-acetylglucosamine kinase-like BadF-type ATPase